MAYFIGGIIVIVLVSLAVYRDAQTADLPCMESPLGWVHKVRTKQTEGAYFKAWVRTPFGRIQSVGTTEQGAIVNLQRLLWKQGWHEY